MSNKGFNNNVYVAAMKKEKLNKGNKVTKDVQEKEKIMNAIVMMSGSKRVVKYNVFGVKEGHLHIVQYSGDEVYVFDASMKQMKHIPDFEKVSIRLNIKHRYILLDKYKLAAYNCIAVNKRHKFADRYEELYLDARNGMRIDSKEEEKKKFELYANYRPKVSKKILFVPNPETTLIDNRTTGAKLFKDAKAQGKEVISFKKIMQDAENDPTYDVAYATGFPGARSIKNYNQLMEGNLKKQELQPNTLELQKLRTYLADLLHSKSEYYLANQTEDICFIYNLPLIDKQNEGNQCVNPELPTWMYKFVSNFNKYNAWRGRKVMMYNTYNGKTIDLTNTPYYDEVDERYYIPTTSNSDMIRESLIAQFETFNYRENLQSMQSIDPMVLKVIRDYGFVEPKQTVEISNYKGYTNVAVKSDIVFEDVVAVLSQSHYNEFIYAEVETRLMYMEEADTRRAVIEALQSEYDELYYTMTKYAQGKDCIDFGIDLATNQELEATWKRLVEVKELIEDCEAELMYLTGVDTATYTDASCLDECSTSDEYEEATTQYVDDSEYVEED